MPLTTATNEEILKKKPLINPKMASPGTDYSQPVVTPNTVTDPREAPKGTVPFKDREPIKNAVGTVIDKWDENRQEPGTILGAAQDAAANTPDRPILDKFQEKFGDDYNNYADTVKETGQTVQDTLMGGKPVIDANGLPVLDANGNPVTTTGVIDTATATGSTTAAELADKNSYLNTTRDAISNIAPSQSFGGTDNYMAEMDTYGPMGKRYSGQEDTSMNRLNEAADTSTMGDKNLSEVLKFKEGLQDTQTGLENELDNYYTKALRGELTADDSEYLKNLDKVYAGDLDKRLKAVTEAAGKQRGIGSGRFNRQLLDAAGDMENKRNLAISELVRGKDTAAANFASGLRNNNAALTQIAANLGMDTTRKSLAADDKLLGHIETAAAKAQGDAKLNFQKEKAALDAEMAKARLTMDQNEWEKLNDQKERELYANTYESFLDDIMSNTLDTGSLYLENKDLEKGDPSLISQAVQGIGSAIKGGQIIKDLVK